MKPTLLLLGALALALTGCDKITGASDQKISDAEAIGYACRVSQKSPEDCMKENETQSPTSVLEGWRSADDDIKSGKLDPKMSSAAPSGKEGEAAAEGDKPAAGEAKKDEKAGGKPVDAKKEEKPAESTGEAKKGATPEAGKDKKPPATKGDKETEKAHG